MGLCENHAEELGVMGNVFAAGMDYLRKEGLGKFIARIVRWPLEYLRWKRIWIQSWLCRNVGFYGRYAALHTLKKKSKVDSCVKFKKIDGGLAFCKRTGQPYEILNDKEKIEVVRAACFEKRKPEKTLFDSPPIYLTVFQEADVYGATNLVTVKDTALSDMAYIDRGKNRYEIAAGAIIGMHKDGRWLQAAYRATDKVIDKAINCVGWACTNYYHFTFEILSRLMYVDGRSEYKDFPILVDAGALAIPQMKDMLDRVNLYHHPIILVGEYERVHVKHLVYVSRNLWMAPGMRKGIIAGAQDYLMSRSMAEHIRSRILEESMQGRRKSSGRKIFLSRRNCKVQRLSNTDEVERIFADNGYRMVFTEEMSYDEQVELFNNADVIVGVTGAAFTNIVYCHEGTQIGIIISDGQPAYFYSNIANMIKAEFTVLGADLVQNGEQISLDIFRLDPAKCRRFIRMIEENDR